MKVKVKRAMLIRGKHVDEGKVIELDEDEAKMMLVRGWVVEAPKKGGGNQPKD